jgi:ssDNA-binding Zn-finger/Zn-ribbon topoisomerase 1
MTSLRANCPACGAEVTFKQGSSVVVVCEFCNSVVARTDRGLEDLGRVAEVAESGSPLEVGLKGVYRGTAFELTGRTQLAHSAGGMWDEWYAAFADGRWGWLAEAQGRFYMSFQAPASVRPPAYDQLTPGETVREIPVPVPLVVAEKGVARYLAAEGEIPFLLTPGETYPYADLSGQGGTFATIDYGEETPLVFVGRDVTLSDIGIVLTGAAREREARKVASAQLQCPQCGGPLELRAPDVAERVTCPNCGSLLDINRGNLRYLKTLQPVGDKPLIPLGAQGEFEGQKLTVLGFMTRSVEFESVRYYWQEYLLYNPAVGFRWLVQSDGHWSYVRTVSPGEVTETGRGASFNGKSYKRFQDALARVDYVTGEFYWKVSVGEKVRAVDYVKAPEMLSKEISGQFGGGDAAALQSEEINWSLGTYIPRKEVEEKFGVKDLPKPVNVAPNQPFPHKGIYKYWALLLLAAIAVGIGTMMLDRKEKVFEQTFTFQPQATPTPTPVAPVVVTQPPARGGARTVPTPVPLPTPPKIIVAEGADVEFNEKPLEIKSRKNLRITAEANVENSWIAVGGDLINEETGVIQPFDLALNYYSGTEGGESWTEGGRSSSTYISALPPGRYAMRVEGQWGEWKSPDPPRVTLRIEQGVTRGVNFLLVLVALCILPLVVALMHMSFEKRRWADSAFNPSDG